MSKPTLEDILKEAKDQGLLSDEDAKRAELMTALITARAEAKVKFGYDDATLDKIADAAIALDREINPCTD